MMRTAVLVALGLFLSAVTVTTLAARLAPAPRAAAPTASVTQEIPRATPSVAPSVTPAVTPAPTTSGGATGAATPVPGASAAGVYTTADVAKHATPADCWIIVAGRVYDVTRYLNQHPGGARTITPWCGKESTVAYETEDGAGSHSSRADRLLESYAIGEVRG